jgi:DNA (cytosine-5)-methyltransferase 1
MRFLSLFSGIEAASVAWEPLGWECAAVAEIDTAASAVLKHHFPDVPNLGDVEKITDEQIADLGHLDVVIGGFPCQDLSVAGKRKGLKHNGENTRSGLFFNAARLVFVARERCEARWAVIGNVPGLFSSHHGRDFASVVGALVGAEFDVPRNGWRNSGFCVGPEGMVEWGVLDAQFWGLAQRRKRVFFVVDFGDWTRRGPLFSQPHRLLWHSPPRREAGQNLARLIAAGSPGSGGYRNDADTAENLISVTLDAASARSRGARTPVEMIAYGGNNTSGPIDVATAVNAHALGSAGHAPAVAYRTSGNCGAWETGDTTDALTTATDPNSHVIAFSSKDDGADAGDISPTLRAGGHADSHANAGVPPAIAYGLRSDLQRSGEAKTPSVDADGHLRLRDAGFNPLEECAPTLDAGAAHAVAFAMRGREGGAMPEAHGAVSALRSASGGSTRDFIATTKVRRLLLVECERLQGFPDNFTRIPIRHFKSKRITKLRAEDRWERDSDGGWWLMQADGARYKQLGNSMAVPVIRWIGEQIMRADEESRA